MSRVTVFACGRANLHGRALPQEVRLQQLPCTGRVSIPLLLSCLTSGQDGVLVVGRHQETCRLRGAEDGVRARVEQTRELASMTGLGADRVAFVQPEPGPDGALRAIDAFCQSLEAVGVNPLREHAALPQLEGLDSSLTLVRWLLARHELQPCGCAWRNSHQIARPQPGATVLAAGLLPFLSVLSADLTRPMHLHQVLASALQVIERAGRGPAGVWMGDPEQLAAPLPEALTQARMVYTLSRSEAEELQRAGIAARAIDELLLDTAKNHPAIRGGTVACDGSAEQSELLRALGFEPITVGADPLPDRFRLSAEDRGRAEARLRTAEQAGAQALLVPDAMSLMRWAMITRQGAWRSSRLLPAMIHQLCALAWSQVPISFRSIPRAEALREVTP